MSDSSSDPVIDDGHQRAVGAPPDVPALPTRLTREYGVRHPFVGAGMGFVAHEQLAAAVTNAGGLGVLGASPDPAESLPVMVERLRALTSGPFGVDLICADTGFGPASTGGLSTRASSWTYRWWYFTMTHRRPAGSARCVPRAYVCGCRPPHPNSPRPRSNSASTG
jgi:hypothetical protein